VTAKKAAIPRGGFYETILQKKNESNFLPPHRAAPMMGDFTVLPF
jgi:hypothetical protein